MWFKPDQKKVLILTAVVMVFFLGLFTYVSSREFVHYTLWIMATFVGLLLLNRRYYFPNSLFWGLLVCFAADVSGEAIGINGVRLYDIVLLPMSDVYELLRYDQLVHFVCTGVITYVLYDVIAPHFKNIKKSFPLILLLIFLAGLGVSIMAEITEFITFLKVPEAKVGGYLNTAFDLIANLLGAFLAILLIVFRTRVLNRD